MADGYIGDRMAIRDIPGYIALHQRGKLPVPQLGSGTISIDHVTQILGPLPDGFVVRQALQSRR